MNLATAFVHPDENHYAEDASWLVAPLSLRTGIHFLRDHPGVHYRFSPDTGALAPWPTTGPNLLGGHLPLHAYVAGLAIALVRPTSRQSTTLVARAVDVVADTATIALLPALAGTGRWRALLTLYGPTAFLLAFIQPSNGTSRFHMVAPLLCGAIAVAASVVPRRGLLALGAVAILVALLPLLPSRPGADGTVDLGDVLFWNPQAPQLYGFYWPWKGRSIVVQVEAGIPLSRRLWLPAGAYEVGVRSDGPVDVTLDRQPAVTNGGGRGSVTVGRFPRIALSTPSSARLKEITVRPTPSPSP